MKPIRYHGKVVFTARSENPISQKQLNALFKEREKHPKVECPVCHELDNYWPERHSLCLDCFCAALFILKEQLPASAIRPLEEAQRLLEAIANDGARLPQLAEAVLKRRHITLPAPEKPAPKKPKMTSEQKKEYARQWQRAYWKRNHEKALDKQRRYRALHRIEIREKAREYRARRKQQKSST